jgi:Undecaprenyl-phosphate glucose phosphotransferase
MIRRRLNYVGFCLRLVMLSLPFLAFALAGYVRFISGILPLRSSETDAAPYFGLLLFTTVVWAVAIDHFGLSQVDEVFAATGKTRRLLSASVATYAAVMAVTFFYRDVSFSRLFVFLSAVALLLLGWTTRIAFRVLLDWDRRNENRSVRVLVVGADEFAGKVARRLVDGQVMPCTIAGFVRLPGQEVRAEGRPVFEMEEASKLALGNGIDDIVVAIPPGRFGELPEIATKFEPLCVPQRAVLDLGEGVSIREKVFDFGGIPMLDLRATPADSVDYCVLKRAFDVVFSLVAIVLSAPLMALIALAIKLTSDGPIFFVQDRVGLNGKIFRMYKFRTMRMGTPEENDTRWTTTDDERRTKLGAFLRRWNLDELPQLFNVFRGDMSMVGPRPERPFFVQKFLQEVTKYNTRHYLKVGITGWAQVNGWRGDTSIARRVEYDLYYLRNWSLTFDLQIILLTALRMFSSKNAY